MYACLIASMQNTEQLPRVSKESGVNIITGTSYYVDAAVPPDVKSLSVQEVHVHLMRPGIGRNASFAMSD